MNEIELILTIILILIIFKIAKKTDIMDKNYLHRFSYIIIRELFYGKWSDDVTLIEIAQLLEGKRYRLIQISF